MKNLTLGLAFLCLISLIHAENIVFPADATGVVDVTKAPYFAKGDGVTDNTEIFKKVYAENRDSKTIYFPNGTYLISDVFGAAGGSKPHGKDRFINLQGQSEKGVVIKLKDNAPKYQDAKKPRPVVSFYWGKQTGDAMRNYMFNMTVDAGKGNPGACGVRYISNNTGAIRNVTIRSSDPEKAGHIGLDMTQGQNGPNLVHYVTIDGFDYGIKCGSSFALVFEHINLKNQKKMVIQNSFAVSTYRKIKSVNTVPALEIDKWGCVMLYDCEFLGGNPEGTAIFTNGKNLYMRDTKFGGYLHAISTAKKDKKGNRAAGKFVDAGENGMIAEWSNTPFQTLGSKPAKSMRLPVEETPIIPWDDNLDNWVKVEYDPNAKDNSDAVQAAFDKCAAENKTTVYFPKLKKEKLPNGKSKKHEYKISRPIKIHGSIRRVMGLQAGVTIIDPIYSSKNNEAVFVFKDLTSDSVVFERFWMFPWKRKDNFYIFKNESGKKVIVRNLVHCSGAHKAATPNGGTWFIEDIPAWGVHMGPGEKGYFRQWNPESPNKTFVTLDNATLWVMGIKTEGRYTHVDAKNNSKAEILGGHSYQSWGGQKHNPPMFVIEDSDVSATMRIFASGKGKWFKTIVKETQKGQSKTLPSKAIKNGFLSLFRANKE